MKVSKDVPPTRLKGESIGGRPQAHARLMLPDGHVDWSGLASEIVVHLAAGLSDTETAKLLDTNRMAIWRLRQIPEFMEELDRLTMMTGAAQRAERMRTVKRIIARLERQALESNKIGDTLLDYLKFAQSETDGATLNLDLNKFFAAISADGSAVARVKPASLPPLSTINDDEDDEWTDGTGDEL